MELEGGGKLRSKDGCLSTVDESMRRLELIALSPAQLLVVDPKKRMTSVEALKHPWVGKADVGSTNLFAKKEFKVTQAIPAAASRHAAILLAGSLGAHHPTAEWPAERE